MHWRDNMYTLAPRTPDRSPNLASFLDAMSDKSYNAPELIQEDLLCFFGFSRRGVELVGDLDERMGKAEMLKMMEEDAAAGSSGAAVPPKKGPKKMMASTQPEKEARREKKKEEEASTSGGCESFRGPNYLGMILISPGFSVPLALILTLAPCAGNGVGGEVVRRLTRAHRAVTTTRRSFDEAMSQHAELVARLEELEALRIQEQRAAEAREEALEDRLAVKKAAWEATKSELDTVLAKKTVVEVELEETKARAEEEVGRLKSEKSLRYFTDGFAGCLAQFRANGYSEEEHPASFLDAKKALMEMPDEEAEEEEEEQGDADAIPPSSPPQ
ncbi:hypothetical protein F511_11196 [Dorcoceras hygrometricum]|uniref:Uncharacterized protein n=1 Tax=Dorcoceras hygrometricum TaxID=472368 RepID=A0A2Z7D4V8_9LAMI|nr:hypothetical protein F511_11196 [Dorcoceras hygrometricum]